METVKLYDQDAFQTRFSGTVVRCEAGKNGYDIVLDQTVFYPEGGGQPADHGTLGGVAVLDVHEKGGVITHTCSGPLTPGAVVEGEIDWARRFDHMQQHSGEHICSGLICGQFHCENVGFHLGTEIVTVDFNAAITWDDLRDIEARANRYIYENHPMRAQVYRGAELDALEYRSKKPLEGDVRIVDFPGADCCACCGTHVARSGEIGLIKFLSCQKFREGVRIELLCGGRALRYLSAVWEQNLHLAQSLSVKPTESAAAVARLQDELTAAKLRTTRLEEQVFAQIARQYQGAGDVFLWQDSLSSDSLRRLCDTVTRACGGRCVVFAGGGDAWKYAIGQTGGDLRELTRALNAALHGRGGGRPHFVQGSAACTRQEIEAFFAG